MRVIAGTARSIMLVTPEGKGTRPTTDRIKETLFNVIQSDIAGARVLDLFAGSGALGIEALSRGAEKAVFVDKSGEAVSCISKNLKKTKFDGTDKSLVLQCEFDRAIMRLSDRKESFDLIFIDPPYGLGLEYQSLVKLFDAGLIEDDALVVVEEAKEHDPEALLSLPLELIKTKEYKTNRHYFLRVRL